MMLYGTGVYTAGLFSIRPPRVLGLTFIAAWASSRCCASRIRRRLGGAVVRSAAYRLRGLYPAETTADGGLMSEPVKPDDIDAVIHERVRLAIVAALAVSPQLSFNELKSMLGLTDGNLSATRGRSTRRATSSSRRAFAGRRPYTAMRLTPRAQGLRALPGQLRQIIDRGSRGRETTHREHCGRGLFFWLVYFDYKVLCRSNIMRRWFHALDRILRGEATRPAALRDADARSPRGRPFAGDPADGAVVRRLFGASTPVAAREDPSSMQWLSTHAEGPGPVLPDPGRDLSLALRLQCPDRLAAEHPRAVFNSSSPRWR